MGRGLEIVRLVGIWERTKAAREAIQLFMAATTGWGTQSPSSRSTAGVDVGGGEGGLGLFLEGAIIDGHKIWPGHEADDGGGDGVHAGAGAVGHAKEAGGDAAAAVALVEEGVHVVGEEFHAGVDGATIHGVVVAFAVGEAGFAVVGEGVGGEVEHGIFYVEDLANVVAVGGVGGGGEDAGEVEDVAKVVGALVVLFEVEVEVAGGGGAAVVDVGAVVVEVGVGLVGVDADATDRKS